MGVSEKIMAKTASAHVAAIRLKDALLRRVGDRSGQATTEYAIHVGVLVVIAVLAIALFRPKIEELWATIADSINTL